MRYFFDTEFQSLPDGRCELISIAFTNGEREIHLGRYDYDLQLTSDWVQDNVFCHLPDHLDRSFWRTDEELRRDLNTFFLYRQPELWGWYVAQDISLLQNFFGGWGRCGWVPYIAHDVATLMALTRTRPLKKPHNAHNALADARWTRDNFLEARASMQYEGSVHLIDNLHQESMTWLMS